VSIARLQKLLAKCTKRRVNVGKPNA